MLSLSRFERIPFSRYNNGSCLCVRATGFVTESAPSLQTSPANLRPPRSMPLQWLTADQEHGFRVNLRRTSTHSGFASPFSEFHLFGFSRLFIITIRPVLFAFNASALIHSPQHGFHFASTGVHQWAEPLIRNTPVTNLSHLFKSLVPPRPVGWQST